MTENKQSVLLEEQRLTTRWQIPKSLDAKVIILAIEGPVDEQKETSEQCFQGSLSNICELGAQIIVEAAFWEQLHANQNVKLQIALSSCETEIKTEVIGQVKYVVPDEQENKIKLGIKFSESGINADIKLAINRISESSDACSKCKFEECTNL